MIRFGPRGSVRHKIQATVTGFRLSVIHSNSLPLVDVGYFDCLIGVSMTGGWDAACGLRITNRFAVDRFFSLMMVLFPSSPFVYPPARSCNAYLTGCFSPPSLPDLREQGVRFGGSVVVPFSSRSFPYGRRMRSPSPMPPPPMQFVTAATFANLFSLISPPTPRSFRFRNGISNCRTRRTT